MPETVNRIDWPDGYDRTPADEREPYPGDITVDHRTAFTSIREELERWGAVLDRVETATTHYANDSDIPHKSSDPDDPGVAVYFRKEGEHADRGYAIACDRWNTLTENGRAIALYVRRKRLAERCGVATAESEFATAALPGEESVDGAVEVAPPAHEVLGVAPDAPEAVVKGAYRARIKEVHPDQGGSREAYERVQDAKEELLG